MAIHNNLAVLMAKQKKFSVEEMSESTGISRNSIVNLKYNRAKGIQYSTLEAICRYFNVTIAEMLTIDDAAS